MTPTTWNDLEENHPAEYREKFLDWIYDSANVGNCWVAVHVAAARR